MVPFSRKYNEGMVNLNSEIRRFNYPDGSIQDVQIVSFDSFDDLHFLFPEYSPEAFYALCDLYKKYFIPRFCWYYDKVVLFRIPGDLKVPRLSLPEKYGEVKEDLTRVNIAFRENCYLKNGKICFRDVATGELFEELYSRGDLQIAEGDRDSLTFLPVGEHIGFLSRSAKDASLKVNASFFVMDKLDLGSVYDRIGTPIGLCVKDGKILNPPQYDREVLTVRSDTVAVEKIPLSSVTIRIGKQEFRDGVNAEFITRPKYKKSPSGGTDIVIVENRVIALKEGGRAEVPSGGLIIKTKDLLDIEEGSVEYTGLEDLSFAIQAGNSVLINGKKTERFLSPFYHFLNPWETSYPPAMYPLNYKKARAPRIVLGADEQNKPKLLWFEGAGKFGYEKGKESCGASLSETAEMCKKLGLQNAVHLDGGGSAQILLNGKRYLKLSDRDPEDLTEIERAISIGINI